MLERRIVVAVPARDEGAGVVATLRALAAQEGAPPFQTLLLVNNSRDDTAAQARAFARQVPGFCLQVEEVTLPPREANVVGARRAALDWAAALAGPGGIIVSTDADTQAAPDWLAALVQPLCANRAVQASAGRILLQAAERAKLPDPVRRTYLLDTGYRDAASRLRARVLPDPFDPAPRHWQHFGASLALRVSAYRAVGGVPQVPCLEDLALVQALARADLPLRHTSQARVYTSARLCGRVPVGLSTQLGEWARGPQHWQVPGGAEVWRLAQAEAALRRSWQARRLAPELAAQWLTSEAALGAALHAPRWGLALERAHEVREAEGRWQRTFAPIPVWDALQEVRALLSTLPEERPLTAEVCAP